MKKEIHPGSVGPYLGLENEPGTFEAVRAAETANRPRVPSFPTCLTISGHQSNAIIGFTTLAVSNIDDKNKVRDYLGKILSSSNHLLSLINDILDMSRIESGKIHLEETEVSLSDVLHDLKTIIAGRSMRNSWSFIWMPWM